ncbi:MAG: UDP-N-acetylmuramate dehydrogenase [Candidatus Omnitrophota bacterium]
MNDYKFLEKAGCEVAANVRLEKFTTFQLGGPCPCLVSCQTPQQLEQTIRELLNRKLKFILIGSGSNLLVSDSGLDCVVVRFVSEKPLIELSGEKILVSSSTLLDDLALFAAQHSLEGLNCTTGIPGTVGGAIVGNAGAFGKQISDCLESIELLDEGGIKQTVFPSSLDFQYRHSNLKEANKIVLSACFKLIRGDKEKLLSERQEILKIRHEKHPDLMHYPCAGSFFKNIEPTSAAGRRQAAGWFLEQAGAKEMKVGGAVVYEKHANIIVKSSGCTSQNVYDLSRKMAEVVQKQFGFSLTREVRLVGEFSGCLDGSCQIIK